MITFIVTPAVSLLVTVVASFIDIQLRGRAPIFQFPSDFKPVPTTGQRLRVDDQKDIADNDEGLEA